MSPSSRRTGRIGHLICAVRLQHVTRLIGSHQSVISEIERGILDPPLGVFLKLCQALDI